MTTSPATTPPPAEAALDAESVDRSAWLTLAMCSVVVFMVSVEITIISLAFPQIRAAFPDAAESTLSWIITGYNIGVASLLLVSGWLADRYGRRRLFLLGLAVFLVGSFLAGLAPTAELLIAARVLQSIGGSLQYPAGLALLLAAFPPAKRQMAIGIWGAMGGLAAAVGPTLGALLVDAFGWRAVFFINVPIALGGLLLGRRWLVESVGEVAERVELVSVPLASIGVGAIILGIVQGPDWGWFAPATIGTFLLGVVLILAFIQRSWRTAEPLFDLGLFSLRSFRVANLGTVLFTIAFFSWLVPLPTYLQSVWGWSVLQTGFAIAPGPLVAFFISPPAGRLAERIGNGPILTIGGFSGAIGTGLLFFNMTTTPDYVTKLLIPSLFIGVAAGCGFAQLVGAAMRDVGPAKFAMAGAGRTTIFQLSVALAIAIGFSIIGRPMFPSSTLLVYRQSWIVACVLYLLQAAVFALLYPPKEST